MTEIERLGLILGAGFLSGVLNTVASAGSAVTLPLLIFLGLPPNIANATNRIQVAAGRVSSIIAFQRAKAIDWRNSLILCIPSLLGTLLGAYIAAIIPARYIGWSITVAVVVTLVLILYNPKKLLQEQRLEKPVIRWWHLGLYFLVGCWGGYIILDGNAFALLVLVLAIGYDLKKANAVKAVAQFPTSTASLVLFTFAHEVDWHTGLLLSAGSFAGSWIGAVVATKEWAKIWIVRLLVALLLVEIVQLIDKYFYRYLDSLMKFIY